MKKLKISIIDLIHNSPSQSLYRRFNANKMAAPRWITLLLSLTIGGAGKIRSLTTIIENLKRKPEFQSFVNKETSKIPQFMIDTVSNDLGPLWEWLPNKSLSYDTNILSNPSVLK